MVQTDKQERYSNSEVNKKWYKSVMSLDYQNNLPSTTYVTVVADITPWLRREEWCAKNIRRTRQSVIASKPHVSQEWQL